VVATELITGWWNSDRLFCVAVGFLAVLSAASTVTGVILLLLRRGVGRWMVVFGAAVALLTFGSVFVAGARLAWPVYLVPLLPLASLVLALHPATKRWGDG
jgi:predicted membrane-bound dolichyl-phosphate-mannose-protein mannosyltransferase